MRKQKYKGRCEKRILSKSDEVCRFYSDLQSKYADKLDSDNGIKQIHCNVYLCNSEYMSDFLCTRKNGDVFIRECVERRFLNKPMTIKMLDISRNYWLNHGIHSISGLMENIVSDKHVLCKKFSIDIGKHEWINRLVPGTMVTDKGKEYVSAAFEQLTELGIKIINLPAYRPELKGRVEKFFDIIQNLYKSQLKGMGVIETDYLQRGTHDYKKDAKLTLDDFEKIILHCILYYNTKYIIKNFSYTEDMMLF